MPNPLRSQQNRIIQVIVRGITIAKSLSGVEYEWYIDAQLFLTLLEVEKRHEVVDKGFRGIFRTNQVKSCQQKCLIWAL